MALSCADLCGRYEAALDELNAFDTACTKTTVTDSASGEKRDYNATRQGLVNKCEMLRNAWQDCLRLEASGVTVSGTTESTFVITGHGQTARRRRR